jgi:hypothetical protein
MKKHVVLTVVGGVCYLLGLLLGISNDTEVWAEPFRSVGLVLFAAGFAAWAIVDAIEKRPS